MKKHDQGNSAVGDGGGGSPVAGAIVNSLRDTDILLGRGIGPNEHPGNRRYRTIIHSFQPEYLATKKRREKEKIARKAIQHVEANGARFLRQLSAGAGGEGSCNTAEKSAKKSSRRWVVVEKDVVLEKTKQALRFVGHKQGKDDKGGEEEMDESNDDKHETNSHNKESASIVEAKDMDSFAPVPEQAGSSKRSSTTSGGRRLKKKKNSTAKEVDSSGEEGAPKVKKAVPTNMSGIAAGSAGISSFSSSGEELSDISRLVAAASQQEGGGSTLSVDVSAAVPRLSIPFSSLSSPSQSALAPSSSVGATIPAQHQDLLASLLLAGGYGGTAGASSSVSGEVARLSQLLQQSRRAVGAATSTSASLPSLSLFMNAASDPLVEQATIPGAGLSLVERLLLGGLPPSSLFGTSYAAGLGPGALGAGSSLLQGTGAAGLGGLMRRGAGVGRSEGDLAAHSLHAHLIRQQLENSSQTRITPAQQAHELPMSESQRSASTNLALGLGLGGSLGSGGQASGAGQRHGSSWPPSQNSALLSSLLLSQQQRPANECADMPTGSNTAHLSADTVLRNLTSDFLARREHGQAGSGG